LKRLKTDKKIFGKAWGNLPLFWKNLAKKFGRQAVSRENIK
jgi:hypothetical protein